MLTLKPKLLRYAPNAPEMIVSPTTLASLQSIQMLRSVDGDGHLREFPNSDVEELRLYEARDSRPPGKTVSQPVATVLLRNEIVADHRIGILSKAVVRHDHRGHHLAPITAAAPVARQIIIDSYTDDLPFVAFTAVTLAENREVVSSLIRIGAVVIPPNCAGSLHPALGMRQTQIESVARSQFGPLVQVLHWLFTDAALRYLLGIVYEATSEDGYLSPIGDGKALRTRIVGDLADPMVRDIIFKLAHGQCSMPVAVTKF
jgi:hypothetical protein